MGEVLRTPDARYIVVDGFLWRASNPALGEELRERLVAELMDARRAVSAALRANDKIGEKAARSRVHDAKVGLGERGDVWWTDGAPNLNRQRIETTAYAGWYAARSD